MKRLALTFLTFLTLILTPSLTLAADVSPVINIGGRLRPMRSGDTLGLGLGGTGANSAATARTALGLAIGTNVQAYDADLTTYAGITPSANVQSYLGAANYAAMRTQLTLTVGTDVQAYDVDLTTYAGITPSANVQSYLGAANYAAMRTQLTLVPGTDVQAYDAELAALAGLTSANDRTPYFTGSGTAALATYTAAGRSMDGAADAAAQRTLLSLVASATTDTTNASNISTGTLASARGGAGTLTGILKGNGAGVVSAAVSATDYAPATTGSAILKASSGGFAAAASGTDYAPATSGSAILKGNAAGGFSSATAGTDYLVSPTPDFFYITSANQTGTNVNTAQPWFTTTGGATLAASTTYLFEGQLRFTRSAGTTAHTVAALFGGTATITSISFDIECKSSIGNVLGTTSEIRADAAAGAVCTASSASATENVFIRVKGVVRINATGTLIPQFQFSAAPGQTPTLLANSYFWLTNMGNSSVTTRGTWP